MPTPTPAESRRAAPPGDRPEAGGRRRLVRAAALLLATATALTACAGDGGGGSGEGDGATTATGPVDLSEVCPSTVVVQTPWTPQAEHGAFYELLGEDREIDTGAKLVRGPLVAQGEQTGVQLEVRAGGPAKGFEPTASLMHADDSITLGMVSTDDAIGAATDKPVTAVMAPLDIAPYMIMWDPKTHPEFQSITDIGQTDTTVLYYKGAPYMDYLIGSGILKKSQVDASYDGSPSRFVASEGEIAQQGFATNEPFLYERALPQWGKEIAFQLVHDTGYPIYPEAVVVRRGAKEELAPCLERLVPVLQQAQVDYARAPKQTNDLLVELVRKYKAGYEYTAKQAAFSAKQQVELGIVGDGTDSTLGDFEKERVRRVLDIITPIWQGQNRDVDPDLTPGQLVTNEFVDPSISLGR